MSELEDLTKQLGQTSIPREDGVSFAGKGKTWNNEEDAQEVVDKINACPNMEYLNLEGNTLGVKAAEAIAKALEDKTHMKKALWKDMFTGRKKDEIPVALKHLCNALMKANAKLEILDLSDNASGPIGVEGIVDLIRSPTCYSLKELKLNNMGLGVTGAKILAKALNDCYNSSKSTGKPLALKTFIAGRNRLENEGSIALAKVFEKIGSLEVFQVPQNGIYLPGISALSHAFANNPNLREINLNDNTLNPEGTLAVSESLTNLKGLVKLDLGDCLIKSKGALHLAKALESGHSKLEEVIVSFNSIKTSEGIAILEAASKNKNLRKLNIDGNNFGEDGKVMLRNAAKDAGTEAALCSLSEDEGCDDGSEDECNEDNYEPEEEKSWSGTEDGDSDPKDDYDSEESPENEDIIQSGHSSHPKTGSAKEFLENPTDYNLNKLGDSAVSSIIQEIKVLQDSDVSKLNDVANSSNTEEDVYKELNGEFKPPGLNEEGLTAFQLKEESKMYKFNEDSKIIKLNKGVKTPDWGVLNGEFMTCNQNKLMNHFIIDKKEVSFSEKAERVRKISSSSVLTSKSPSQNEDSCEIVAKLVSAKLRQMDDSTALLAERLINQVLYEGLFGNLNPDSKLVLNPHHHRT